MKTSTKGAGLALALLLSSCKGSAGPAGAEGLAGNAGTQGAQGAKGDTGAQGVPGPKGDKGDPGTQGIQGVQGVAAPHAAWVDAAGTEVRIAFNGTSSVFVDPAGFVWTVDLETGALTRPTAASVSFASTDCTGTGYVRPDAPRVVTALGDGSLVARADSQPVVTFTAGSFFSHGSTTCTHVTAASSQGLEADLLRPVVSVADLVGPVHLDAR